MKLSASHHHHKRLVHCIESFSLVKIYTVANRPIARQRSRNKQRDNDLYYTAVRKDKGMALSATSAKQQLNNNGGAVFPGPSLQRCL